MVDGRQVVRVAEGMKVRMSSDQFRNWSSCLNRVIVISFLFSFNPSSVSLVFLLLNYHLTPLSDRSPAMTPERLF
ncbi:hypothetical protein CPC08DRAFT_460486 [Agrocybe pediades]|nr:hypothetical protein CPC08DRAFT_460486 [Agrocybe pediades]